MMTVMLAMMRIRMTSGGDDDGNDGNAVDGDDGMTSDGGGYGDYDGDACVMVP